MNIAKNLKPQYYVVIFTSKHTNVEKEEYYKTSTNMV